MAEAHLDHWFVMRESGLPTNAAKLHSTIREDSFFSLLNDLYREHQTAGSVWDRPKKLFLNGKEINLGMSLADYVWQYGNALQEAIEKAETDVRRVYLVKELANGYS